MYKSIILYYLYCTKKHAAAAKNKINPCTCRKIIVTVKIEIMDTTLRDGEQTSGVSFTEKEKFTIAKQLLVDVKVDRLEIASARVSQGEFDAVSRIITWATHNRCIDKIEVLGFVDGSISIDWLVGAGAKCLNLLCKGSLKHVKGQLKKEPAEHIADIKETLAYAMEKNIAVNVYLEDWSNGMKESPEYVYYFINELKDTPIKRFMLPDTLGILNPTQTFNFCADIVRRFPDLHFDFHGHNDYDLSVANALSAIQAGCKGIHTSVNGLGERTGNTILSSIVPAINDHLQYTVNIDEEQLNKVSKIVEVFSGIRIPPNKPIIGDNVFTQTAGVHADGDNKGNLYCSLLMPERFGRVRKYALGKTSGKANIMKNLEELGIELDTETMKKVTQKVIELGDKKETITTEDLPFIIREVLGNKVKEEKVKITNYCLAYAQGLRPVATVCLDYAGTQYQKTLPGDGLYDAFFNCIKDIYSRLEINLPELIDYEVSIPPGGRTDALVETIITWQVKDRLIKTRGLDPDQTAAAIIATTKILNIIEEYNAI